MVFYAVSGGGVSDFKTILFGELKIMEARDNTFVGEVMEVLGRRE